MFAFTATMLLAAVLPASPTVFGVPCRTDGTFGTGAPGLPMVVAQGVDNVTPGTAIAHYLMIGYKPKEKLESDGSILVIRLDANPTVYTNLGVQNGNGRFDVGFSDLSKGEHVLRVAVLASLKDTDPSYSTACFPVN
jgi:hypothetical protein